MICDLTHAEHLATWKSWRDDCDGCGFGMQDLDQCERGHPDDGCEWCGACGYDAVYDALGPGEFWAIMRKAQAAGQDFTDWSIAQTIRAYALTPAEQAEAARANEETLSKILAIRAGRP